MSTDTLSREFEATVPADTDDPPRFGQPTETIKDTLVLELRKFIANASLSDALREELPTVEKYASFTTDDPYASAAVILRKHPEVLEDLPHVAVMAATGVERRYSIGNPYIGVVQEPPRILATAAEPYALEDGDVIAFRTKSAVNGEIAVSTVVFSANRFPTSDPIGAALTQAIADEINAQTYHVYARAITVDDDIFLQIEAGDSRDDRMPIEIELDVTTSQNVLDVTGLGRTGSVTDIGGTRPNMSLTSDPASFTLSDLGLYVVVQDASKSYFNDGRFEIVNGVDTTLAYTNKYGRTETGSPATWFIGARDDIFNQDRPPKHRRVMSMDAGVQIDVICEDENTRGELSDLIFSFFTFFLEKKYYSFYGRSVFDSTVADEHFQIVLKSDFRLGGETEIPRPSGDGTNKVYVSSFTANVICDQYIDRTAFWSGTTTPAIATPDNFTIDPELRTDHPTSDTELETDLEGQ